MWAAWLRRLRRTGQFLFSGAYAVRTLPGAARPSVHVTFPLEKGDVEVFLRPEVRSDGALVRFRRAARSVVMAPMSSCRER